MHCEGQRFDHTSVLTRASSFKFHFLIVPCTPFPMRYHTIILLLLIDTVTLTFNFPRVHYPVLYTYNTPKLLYVTIVLILYQFICSAITTLH